MKVIRNLVICMVAAAILTATTTAEAALITSDVVGWVAHNGPSAGPAVTINDPDTNDPSIPGGTSAAPALPAGAQYAMMAPINPVTLANEGDYIQFTVFVQMFGRTTTGPANLNNNLRFGLFSFTGTDAFDGNSHDPVVPSDVSNHGIFARYGNSNSAANHPGVHEQSGNAVNPFLGSLSNIGTVDNGFVTPDAGGDSIAGANPGIISYDMTIKRTSDGKLDIFGLISGDDYLSTFNVQGHTSTAYPENGPFTFNRVGLYFNNASVGSGTDPRIEITDALITTNVPEPGSCAIATLTLLGGLLVGRRNGRPE